MAFPDGTRLPDGHGAIPLRLDPFRAITYADHDSLPRVTSPPYDVVGPGGMAALEAADPHNIVRLILPRSRVGGSQGDDSQGDGSQGDGSQYRRAADALSRWHDSGVLVTDQQPALWVYRHTTSDGVAVGLVGAVGVDGPIHPHESTFDRPVADRAALMTATRAQLEPILLTYHGDGAASDVVDTTLATSPTVSAVVEDGSRHEMWRVPDPDVHARVAADLAGRHALIADGHHRFSAYRRVHATERSSGTSGGLAVLVDATRHPLELRGVHRVIAGLALDDAVSQAIAAGFAIASDANADDDSRETRAHDTSAASPRATGPGKTANADAATFVLTDDHRTVRIAATDAAYGVVPRTGSDGRRVADAVLLKHALLETAWAVDNDRVSYIHDAVDASALARAHAGVAVLVSPPSVDHVMQTAEVGETMPQKSTSFGPKPRTGLLMRWTH